MKILFTILFIFASVSPAMADFTLGDILLKKDLKNTSGIFMTAHISVKAYCKKSGNLLSVGSYEAAQFLEKLDDGLYRCFGEFAKLPNTPIIAFKLDRCEKLNPEDMNRNCNKE